MLIRSTQITQSLICIEALTIFTVRKILNSKLTIISKPQTGIVFILFYFFFIDLGFCIVKCFYDPTPLELLDWQAEKRMNTDNLYFYWATWTDTKNWDSPDQTRIYGRPIKQASIFEIHEKQIHFYRKKLTQM